MMNDREVEKERYKNLAREKYDLLKVKIKIPNDVQHQVALKSEKIRLLSVVDCPYAIDLFRNELISFDNLDLAESLDDATKIIDKFINIKDFYKKNYSTFHWMIEEPFFKKRLQGGDLDCWQAFLDSPINYKRLSYGQATSYVLSKLNQPEHKHHYHVSLSQDMSALQNKMLEQTEGIKPDAVDDTVIVQPVSKPKM